MAGVPEKYANLLEKEWVVQTCEATQLLWSPPGIASTQTLSELVGYGYSAILAYVENDFGYWFYWEDDLTRLAEEAVAKEAENPGYVEKLIAKWDGDRRRFLARCDRVDGIDLTSLSDGELKAEYEEWHNAHLRAWGIAMLCDAFSLHSEKMVSSRLQPLLAARGEESSFAKVLPVLTAPVGKSFAISETASLLFIANAAGKDAMLKGAFGLPSSERMHRLRANAPFFRRLARHSRNFFWLHNSYLRTRYLDESYFAERIADILKGGLDIEAELARVEALPRKARQEKEKMCRELGIGVEFRRLLGLVELFAQWQDERKKTSLIADHYLVLFASELSRRRGCQMRDCLSIASSEYGGALGGKPDSNELAARTGKSMQVFTPAGVEFLSGEPAQALFKALRKETNYDVEDVRGTCASPGRVEGPVRIVMATKDLPKMRKGDVLVSGMTRPELVPAMKKAAAIVTDEGGITSHAAIVSRELGIPCVIGTKIATKVFKDGDFVEVNANHGVVRKVEGGRGDTRRGKGIPPRGVNANHGIVRKVQG